MRKMVSTAGWAFALAALCPACDREPSVAGSAGAYADPSPPSGVIEDACGQVNAAIVTNYFSQGCASPVGICTAGDVSGGLLAGSTRFSVATMHPVAPNNPYVLAYTGELVITTAQGTLVILDSGTFDAASGTYFESQEAVHGSGRWTGASGQVTSQGTSTPTGFSGNLSGEVCTPRSHHLGGP